MRKFLFVTLIGLGAVEIAFGLALGRLRIYWLEGMMYRDLQLGNVNADRAFLNYISHFKDQWYVVFWFGLLTVILACSWMYIDSRRLAPRK